MQRTEGEGRSCHRYLQILALQCLFWPQHVYAAENRFLQGIVFKEYLLSISEQPED